MPTLYPQADKSDMPERKKFDLYPTPRPLIRAVLYRFKLPSLNQNIKSILDVGAGDGRWGQIAKEFTGAKYLAGVDIRDLPSPEGFDLWLPNTDFRRMRRFDGYDLIVGNPPYYIAEDCVRQGWFKLNYNCWMVYLFKLDFLAGQDRFKFLWSEVNLAEFSVSVVRPQFYGTGTGGDNFAAYYFHKVETFDPYEFKGSYFTYNAKDSGQSFIE